MIADNETRLLRKLGHPSIGMGLGLRLGGGGRGRVNLDFTGGGLPSGVTFTRASVGRYFNASGVFSSAAVDAARFDYNAATLALRGFLYEPQKTNLLVRSQALDNASWTHYEIDVVTGIGSPDGGSNAQKIRATATSPSSHQNYQISISITSGATYTASCFMKAAEYGWGIINLYDGGNHYSWFNLSTGVPGTSSTGNTATITDVGGGWYFCTATRVMGASSGGVSIEFSNADNVSSFVAAIGSGINVFQADLQAGSGTSPIVTATAQVTRSADACSFSIPPGVFSIRYTFDDSSTQDISVTPGAYTIPTNLNRSRIKRITSL